MITLTPSQFNRLAIPVRWQIAEMKSDLETTEVSYASYKRDKKDILVAFHATQVGHLVFCWSTRPGLQRDSDGNVKKFAPLIMTETDTKAALKAYAELVLRSRRSELMCKPKRRKLV